MTDRTTGLDIVWGTDNYVEFGDEHKANQEIRPALISGRYEGIIQPRTMKETKGNKGVLAKKLKCLIHLGFAMCTTILLMRHGFNWNMFSMCRMGNLGNYWNDSDRTWRDYVSASRLEITYEEAPYLVSRYDAVTGEFMPIE